MDSSERHVPDRAEQPDALPRQGTDSRRHFLAKAGLGGLAITIGSVVVPFDYLLGPAYGQAASKADVAIAAFAQSVELAVAQGYQYAVSTNKVTTPSRLATLTSIGNHHKDHADSFGALTGSAVPTKTNQKLLDVIEGQFKSAQTEAAVLQFAYELENAVTATHLSFLAQLKDTSMVNLAASILPVESQHATVLGLLLNKDPSAVVDYLPSFITQDAAILPKLYPTPTA